ncbi:MAG: PAS domain S-box protein [Planctomycetes bacterium]|nr:PAS domain S-box protein [Planctomycetota bacterium]
MAQSSKKTTSDPVTEVERQLQNQLRGLLDLTDHLTQAQSFDGLCRQAVELGRERLGFDRMGIWFFDRTDPDYIRGSFGTDKEGRTRDERDWRRHLPGIFESLKKTGGNEAVLQEGPFCDAGIEMADKGERVIAPIADGENIIGLLSADNLMSRRRMTQQDREALTLFASILGHLFSRQEAEDARQTSEANLRYIIEQNADAMVILDREGVVRFANPAAEAITGTPADKLIGGTFGLPGRPEERVEIDIFRPGGKPVVAEMRMVEVEWEGEPAYLASLRDVTDRKEAEKQLSESENRYRTLFEDSPEAISLTRQGKIIDVNPAWLRLHGYQRKNEVIGMDVLDVIHPDDRHILEKRRTMPREELDKGYEIRDVRTGGQVVNVQVYSRTVALGGESVIVTTLHDVTERKQAEEQRRQLQAQLLQAQKMEAVGRLAGGVAHDFNNLLTTIQGFAELGLWDADESNPLYDNIKHIHGATLRAANLVRQLLLFSRKQPTDFAPLNVNATISDLLKMLNRIIGEDVTVLTEFDDGPLIIEGDAGNIEQVVMNLALNARDAMPNGGTLTIQTCPATVTEQDVAQTPEAQAGRFVCIRVGDTGAGMDEEVMARIFEPFFTTKGVGKGTGLGLSVVYGIVKDHGGWTRVQSQPGRGSTFEIYLPIAEDTSGAGNSETEHSEMPKGKGERILVVEDEENVRLVAAQALSQYGYDVVPVSSARQALQVFQKLDGEIDLLFSDVVLPDEDGIWLIDELRSRKPDLGVLLASGYSDDKSQWPVIRRRGFHFINKPYKVSDLLNAAQEAIRTPRKET